MLTVVTSDGGQQVMVIVFTFALLGLIAIQSYSPWIGGVAGCVGVSALAFLRFTSIGKLKAGGRDWGIELEKATREAHEASQEARATVRQVRAVAATIGGLALDQLALRGRLGVISARALKAIRDNVIESLLEAGCSDVEAKDAAMLLDGTMRFDLAKGIQDALWRLYREQQPPTEALRTAAETMAALLSFTAPAPPAKFSELLQKHGIVEPDVAKALEDYERFDSKGELPPEERGGFFDMKVLSRATRPRPR